MPRWRGVQTYRQTVLSRFRPNRGRGQALRPRFCRLLPKHCRKITANQHFQSKPKSAVCKHRRNERTLFAVKANYADNGGLQSKSTIDICLYLQRNISRSQFTTSSKRMTLYVKSFVSSVITSFSVRFKLISVGTPLL